MIYTSLALRDRTGLAIAAAARGDYTAIENIVTARWKRSMRRLDSRNTKRDDRLGAQPPHLDCLVEVDIVVGPIAESPDLDVSRR